jgi:hypothetical protein
MLSILVFLAIKRPFTCNLAEGSGVTIPIPTPVLVITKEFAGLFDFIISGSIDPLETFLIANCCSFPIISHTCDRYPPDASCSSLKVGVLLNLA